MLESASRARKKNADIELVFRLCVALVTSNDSPAGQILVQLFQHFMLVYTLVFLVLHVVLYTFVAGGSAVVSS